MCKKDYDPPEMLPYSSFDRESALRLAAQERWDRMVSGRRDDNKERRS